MGEDRINFLFSPNPREVENMAWQFVTKDNAAEFCGVSESFLKDSWSDFIESLIIDKYKDGITTNTYTEDYDGDGTDTLFVDNTPIISVTSLTFRDDTGEVLSYDSLGYHVYRDYVRLNSGKFPTGKQNIRITYDAGDASINPILSMAEMMALAYFVKFMTGKRGDASIRFEKGEAVGRNQFKPHPSIYRKINDLIEEIIPYRIKFS